MMQIAQMVKCSVREQIHSIAVWTMPLAMTIAALLVYEYTQQKENTNSSLNAFTSEMSTLRESLVELKTTIRSIK